MSGVRCDESAFPDGLFIKYGCESGLEFSSDLLTHFDDPVEGTLIHLTQKAKPCQDAEGKGGLNEAVVQ